ncbi:MAG: LytTR family DNA-binding domain-containing protein [Bacteroidales bacterium]|nr:LytTR family DNA-binding domain-containing protein [Bacteroidales bacterium]
MHSTKKTAIIIDDEYLAIREMRTLLQDIPEIEVIGEARNIKDASEIINQFMPDIIFLDIQLKNENGFDLLHQVPPKQNIIFVTAYDQYAIKAFEINALDYLLKPVHPKRLENAVERLLDDEIQSLAPENRNQLEYSDTIFINHNNELRLVKISDIWYISSYGDYTRIAIEDKKMLVLKTMKMWESQLPSTNFMRIHRSTIVNIACIARIEKWFNGTSRLYLKNSEIHLEISQRYTAKLKKICF